MYKFTRSSYFWNHSSEHDTLVNQNSHAPPIRSPVRGRTGFSKSRGLRASVTFFPLPHPAPSTFLLSPHFSCGLFRSARISFASFGNACYAGYHNVGKERLPDKSKDDTGRSPIKISTLFPELFQIARVKVLGTRLEKSESITVLQTRCMTIQWLSCLLGKNWRILFGKFGMLSSSYGGNNGGTYARSVFHHLNIPYLCKWYNVTTSVTLIVCSAHHLSPEISPTNNCLLMFKLSHFKDKFGDCSLVSNRKNK